MQECYDEGSIVFEAISAALRCNIGVTTLICDLRHSWSPKVPDAWPLMRSGCFRRRPPTTSSLFWAKVKRWRVRRRGIGRMGGRRMNAGSLPSSLSSPPINLSPWPLLYLHDHVKKIIKFLFVDNSIKKIPQNCHPLLTLFRLSRICVCARVYP